MNQKLTPQQIIEEMRARIRRYMFIVVLLIIGMVLSMVVVAAIVGASGGSPTANTVAAVVGATLMVGLVATSWVLVSRLWRCPACDANVYWVVARNTSAFAPLASKTCPKCNAVLFEQRTRKRSLRAVMILVGIGVAFALLGAVASGSMHQKRAAVTVTHPQPSSP